MNIHQRSKLLAHLSKRQSALVDVYFQPPFRYHQRWYATEAAAEEPTERRRSESLTGMRLFSFYVIKC